MMDWLIIKNSLITSGVFIDSHSLYPLHFKDRTANDCVRRLKHKNIRLDI